MHNFLIFQKFNNNDDANTVSGLLNENGIANIIEAEKQLLDSNLIGIEYNNSILLKIAPADFEKAQKILIDNTEVDLLTVDPDYMLLSFSNEELMIVIKSPEEWGAYNYKLALALLNKKGTNIDVTKVASMQQEHLVVLAQQKRFDTSWIIFGYIFPVLAIIAGIFAPKALSILYSFWLLPGIAGAIIGWTVNRSKNTLPNGQQVISYDDISRKHGRAMFYLGVLALVFNIAMFVIRAI